MFKVVWVEVLPLLRELEVRGGCCLLIHERQKFLCILRTGMLVVVDFYQAFVTPYFLSMVAMHKYWAWA
jgi:hypothetical protein